MNKRHRITRLLASKVGFCKAAVMVVPGVAILALGTLLSFQNLVQPFQRALGPISKNVFQHVVHADQVDNATWLFGGGCLFLGFYLVFQGVRPGIQLIWGTRNPGFKGGMMDRYFRRLLLMHGVGDE